MFTGAPLPERIVSANAYLGAMPDRARAGRGRRHRDHRPLRRQRGDAGRADARVRLDGRRLRPARRGQPGRPHHRVRRAGHRRPAHRLGQGARLGQHRLPDRRVPRPTAASSSPSPTGTGGLVAPATVAEQMLYEIGDPARLPRCPTWSATSATCASSRRARTACASAARGAAPPTDTYKVSATYMDGFALAGMHDDRRHRRGRQGAAHRRGDRSSAPARMLARAADCPTSPRRSVEVHRRARPRTARIRGPAARARCVMRVAVNHAGQAGAGACSPARSRRAGTSWSPGTTGSGAGRPRRSPWSGSSPSCCRSARSRCSVDGRRPGAAGDDPGGRRVRAAPSAGAARRAGRAAPAARPRGPRSMQRAAGARWRYGRSGDKGDNVQHRPHRAQARVPAGARCEQVTPERGEATTSRTWSRGRSSATRLPGIHARQLPAVRGARRRRHGLAAHDPLGKGMAPDAARHAGRRPRRARARARRRRHAGARRHGRGLRPSPLPQRTHGNAMDIPNTLTAFRNPNYYTADHEQFRDTVRAFVAREIAPLRQRVGRGRDLPARAVPQGRRRSACWAWATPRQYGGTPCRPVLQADPRRGDGALRLRAA